MTKRSRAYITIEDCTVSGCAWYSTFACSGISIWQAWAFDKEPGHHIRIVHNRCFDNRQYLPGRAGGPITDGNGIIVDDSRNTQQARSSAHTPDASSSRGMCVRKIAARATPAWNRSGAASKREAIDAIHPTRADATAAAFDYIETFSNRVRLHSALGYLSPVDFENQLN